MNNPKIIVKNAPFKHFCMSIGAIPTSYKDSLDYYETLLWLIKYLEETIIPTVNNNGEAVSELQTLYIELKNYVDNYFTNLDVQEEINNKLDEMVESGELQEILTVYFNERLAYYKVDNTFTQEQIQEIFTINNPKVIEFTNGNYNFNETFVLNKNTKIILNNAVLNFTTEHAFYNFNFNDEFLEYSGNGNIEIIGGTIIGGSISFCHAKNITIKNTYFLNCLNNHILEFASINNLVIDSCTLEGLKRLGRNYVEYIQIDDMTYSNFPYFSENNATYDNTPNTNWEIKNNILKKPTDNEFDFCTGIGGHTQVENIFHTNIKIHNNIIDGFTFAGIRLRNNKNSVIEYNKITCGVADDVIVNAITCQYTIDNLNINYNDINGDTNGNSRFIYFNTFVKNCNITNNNVYNMYTQSGFLYEEDDDQVIYMNTSENVKIKNNNIYDFGKQLMYVRIVSTSDPARVYFENNNIYNTTFTGYLIRFYSHGNFIINKNNFNIASIQQIVRISGNVTLITAKQNKLNSAIQHKFIYLDTYTGSLKEIDSVMFESYTGNAETLTSQSLTYDYTDFNTCIIICGGGNYTTYYKLKDYNPTLNLTARTYILPAYSTDNSGTLSLTLNSDKTINYSTTNSDVKIRRIYLMNE